MISLVKESIFAEIIRTGVSKELKNALVLSVLALIWGSSFILMSFVLTDSQGEPLYSPLALGSLRLVLAGLVLLPVAIRHFSKLRSALFLPIAIVGIFGNGIPAFLFAISLKEIDTGLAGILNSLVPLFTVITGMLLFGLKLNKKALVGVFIGFVGAAGLVFVKTGGVNTSSVYLGYAGLIVIATICYSLSVNTIQNKLSQTDAIVIASLGLFIAAIPGGVVLCFTDFTDVLLNNKEGVNGLGYCLVLSAVGTAFALVLFNKLVQDSSAVFASLVTYLIPVVAVMWGVYFGEEYSLIQLAFGGIILLGVYLVKLSRNRSMSSSA